MKYKPPVTRGVGGFFTASPEGEVLEEKVNDPLVEVINSKVVEYFKEYGERPNALVVNRSVYQDIDKGYIKELRSRGIIVVVVPSGEDIVVGRAVMG
jgi:hypothetical protein